MKKVVGIPKLCKHCPYCKSISMVQLKDQSKPIIQDGKIVDFKSVMVNYQCERTGQHIVDLKKKLCKVRQIIEEVDNV